MPETQTNPLRHESKIPLQHDQTIELQAALLKLGLHPKSCYPDRIIHSIYLDDHELTDYFDNISGVSRRSKTRIRWYNEHTDTLALEIKRKIIKVSDKRIIRLNNPAGLIPRSRSAYMGLIRENSDKLSVSQFMSISPVLEVEYCRRYFLLSDNIRMTIDNKIRYKNLFPLQSSRWQRSPVDSVVEFKYPLGEEKNFSNLLRNLPFRIFRHSKYVIGVDNVCAG
jgi:SPX domain protein involved in polyphosphate accumulation